MPNRPALMTMLQDMQQELNRGASQENTVHREQEGQIYEIILEKSALNDLTLPVLYSTAGASKPLLCHQLVNSPKEESGESPVTASPFECTRPHWLLQESAAQHRTEFLHHPYYWGMQS